MCLALKPFSHCFALWSLLFFYLFTKECKYLEVVFPLAFHFYRHLPLWKTESFDLSLTKSLFLCDLHLPGALIPPRMALASWRTSEKWPISGFLCTNTLVCKFILADQNMKYFVWVSDSCSFLSLMTLRRTGYFWLTCPQWPWWKCYLLCLHQPPASLTAPNV